MPTRERGAFVSIEATTIPLPKVVVLTASRDLRTGSEPADELGLAAAWAANPRC